MDCCQPEIIRQRFNDEYVQRKLDRYRQVGPKETSQLLIEAIQRKLQPGMTLLDIGGGIGDIQHALIQSGLEKATNVEASKAYLQACRAEANRLGHSTQIRYVEDDFIHASAGLASADIVTLDRVICCYPFMHDLVTMSLAKAKRFYGIVVPLDKWWVKLYTSFYYNVRFFLQGLTFRVFVHPIHEIEARIRKANFRRIFSVERSGWYIALYERTA